MRSAAIVLAAALSLGAAPGAWRHPEGMTPPGRSENVSLTSEGAILLAPEEVEILPGGTDTRVPPILWSLAVDLKQNVFVGGGIGAQVLRLPHDGHPEPFFETSELGVKAVATDVGGQLFVATFPTGRVYRVDDDGSMEAYYEPEERYLWAMATDPFDRLYVATGERGIIYVVTARGEGEVFMDSDEPHITALATDPAGRLIAGSAGRGRLYRLDNQGRPALLLDSRLEEISSIVVASDGTIFAAAISGPGRRLRDGSRRRDDLTIEIAPAAEEDILEEAAEPEPRIVMDLSALVPPEGEGGGGPASIVYRISPEHTPAEVWSSDVERVYALSLDSGGHLLMGTGSPGRLYRLEPDGTATLIRTYPASQITGLAPAAGGETLVLASNPGRLYALKPRPSSSGRYFSPVRDAGAVARWGSIRWDADVPQGTRVDIECRTGNAPLPDTTWSGWSKPSEQPKGSGLDLPDARYMQWRATLSRVKTEATPLLRSVIATYLPENLPPSLREVRVGEPGSARPGKAAAGEEGKGGGEGEPDAPGALWLSWASLDPTGDPLSHEISVRRIEESSWRTLASSVPSPPYRIDPSGLTEGVYVARIVVTDEGVNGEARALTAEGRSPSFDVDKTPPVLVPGRPETLDGTIELSFDVRDEVSSVASCQWALVSDGPWRTILPKDGLADTREETCALKTPAAGAGASIFLRAADPSGNVATLEVQIAGPR